MSSQSDPAVEREVAPEYDEEAFEQYVIVTEKLSRSSEQRYHRPAVGGELRPACDDIRTRGDVTWTKMDRSNSKFDDLALCGHCRGRRTSTPDFSMRDLLHESDPEDFGLEPLPEAPDGGRR